MDYLRLAIGMVLASMATWLRDDPTVPESSASSTLRDFVGGKND
jgi:hypothetical protein